MYCEICITYYNPYQFGLLFNWSLLPGTKYILHAVIYLLTFLFIYPFILDDWVSKKKIPKFLWKE